MSFFVTKNESIADKLMNPDALLAVAPDYYAPRFAAIKELRDQDDGTLHKGNEFRRVASFVNIPLFHAISTVLDPEFMQDKKKFYAFLDRNKVYCTYDLRRNARIMQNQVTFFDGKEI